MDRAATIDCLAIPVAIALDGRQSHEAVLYGLTIGIAIGMHHAELAEAAFPVAADILISSKGIALNPTNGMVFVDDMNDVIEVMTNTLR